MPNYRIYVDLNSIVRSVRTPRKPAVYLTGLGSLIDISRLKLRLFDGLELTAYSDSTEEEELEVPGIVRFDHRAKKWFVEYDGRDMREVPVRPEPKGAKFPCWNCDTELMQQFNAEGWKDGATSRQCGREILELMKPP